MWTVAEANRKKLEAFEMWCYRHIMGMNRVNNKSIRNEEKNIWNANIKNGRDRMVGYLLGNKELIHDIRSGNRNKEK